MAAQDFDSLATNTIRLLAADMVQKANSGHPGMPMGMAPAAHILWSKFMNFSPANPKWANRDRFVLSNGHGCALLYTMLHLCGYKLTMDDLKAFRQLHSKTPGHPESHMTEGIEVTTGPLGQGVANSVGLAVARNHLAAHFNKPGFPLLTNKTYVFLGDGCLQEGISAEAASLAGHLGLEGLVWIYDDNHITIDGDTAVSFTEDVPARFRAYGWHTLEVKNGDEDFKSIEAALAEANAVAGKPVLISLRTQIGYGSSKAGSADSHGSPLGPAVLAATKQRFGFDPEKSFFVPEEVGSFYSSLAAAGNAKEEKWNAMFQEYSAQYPELAAEFRRRFSGELPADWKSLLPQYNAQSPAKATRQLSHEVLNALAVGLPELMGGSADLTHSNLTNLKGAKDFQAASPEGRYIRFGVREHAMAAMGNGMAAYGALIPFTATFLNFVSYCFPSVRLAALSGHRQLFIMTHDSIGLGEDGPTHQPVETCAMLRATPNVLVLRPADGNEVSGSYAVALEHTHGPSVICLSRQALPSLAGSSAAGVAKGAYTVAELGDEKAPLDLTFVATGSEVSLALKAAEKLVAAGKKVRVVSMPSQELFDKQPVEYRRSVIPVGVPTISVEALGVFGWEKYSHYQLGLRSFGASGPAPAVYDYFGLTPEKVVASVASFLDTHQAQCTAMNVATTFAPLATHFGPVARL